MNLQVQFRIKNNPYTAMYLKENSYWYKYLNRNPASIAVLEQEVKEKYRLTMKDKIEDFGSRIELIKNFMDILS